MSSGGSEKQSGPGSDDSEREQMTCDVDDEASRPALSPITTSSDHNNITTDTSVTKPLAVVTDYEPTLLPAKPLFTSDHNIATDSSGAKLAASSDLIVGSSGTELARSSRLTLSLATLLTTSDHNSITVDSPGMKRKPKSTGRRILPTIPTKKGKSVPNGNCKGTIAQVASGASLPLECPSEEKLRAQLESGLVKLDERMKAEFDRQLEVERKAMLLKMTVELEKMKALEADEKEKWTKEVMETVRLEEAQRAEKEFRGTIEKLEKEKVQDKAEIKELKDIATMGSRELVLREITQQNVMKELISINEKYEDASKQANKFAELQKALQMRAEELAKELVEEKEQHQHELTEQWNHQQQEKEALLQEHQESLWEAREHRDKAKQELKEAHEKFQDEADKCNKELEKVREDNAELAKMLDEARVERDRVKDELESVCQGIETAISEREEIEQDPHQEEEIDLSSKLVRRDAVIKSLTSSRSTLERRLERCQEERDRLAQQVSTAEAVNPTVGPKITGVESLVEEKRMMVQEIRDLQNEIQVRKLEADVIRQDFEQERRDRENYASRHDDEVQRWVVLQQDYEVRIQSLEEKINDTTRESEQTKFELSCHLEDMEERTKMAVQCQKETDEKCDYLREERDTFHLELNRVGDMYEEQKKRHQLSLEDLEKVKQQLAEQLQVAEDERRGIQAALESEKRELDTRLLEARVEIKNLLQQLDEAKSRSEHLRTSMNEQLLEYQQERERLTDECAAAHQRAITAEDRVGEVEERLAMIEPCLRESEDRMHQLDAPWVVEKKEIQLTDEELGRGGWATVSVATFRGVRVAAKCVHKQIVSDYNISLFKREMSMAARIRHPNLLQFIGATLEGELIILTEYMPTSLRKELESLQGRKLIPLKQVSSISKDVAGALNYLHLMRPHPLIHRDISSGNILLQPLPNSEWRAKVSDYGTVNLYDKLQTQCPGNYEYSAPEASDPSKQSPKMDIFSFGVLLMEMLTGEFPESNERKRQLLKISSHSLFGLIQKCLSQEKAKRPTASDIIVQLTSL